jgi:hypothetical protein
MKQRWRTPLALLSACTFAVLAVGGAAAVGRNGAGAQETLQFVALGDSYGSGTGAATTSRDRPMTSRSAIAAATRLTPSTRLPGKVR